MLLRIADIDKNLPMTFIYGAESWMDKTCGHQAKSIRNESHVEVKVSHRKLILYLKHTVVFQKSY